MVILSLIIAGLTFSAARGQNIVDPGPAYQDLEKVINLVPGAKPLGCLVKDFSSIIKPESYSADETQGSNAGLIVHNDALISSDVKLASQAKEFYRALAVEDEALGLKKNGRTPLLLDAPGDGPFSNVKPGFVWNLALKNADGDPNRALQIIGLCGHDDYEVHISPSPQSSEEQAKDLQETASFIDTTITSVTAQNESSQNKPSRCKYPAGALAGVTIVTARDLKDTIDHYRSCITPANKSIFIKDINSLKLKLKKENFAKTKITCPGASSSQFYLGEGLGKGVDISKKLKDRILGTSDLGVDLNKPSRSIPSKYYHVLGSAAVACELIAKGHNPKQVTRLLEMAGWAYRVYWLSRLASESRTESFPETDLNKVIAWLKKPSFNKCDNSLPPEETLRPNSQRDAMFLLRSWALNGDDIKTFGGPGEKLSGVYTNLLNPIGELGVHDITSSVAKPRGWTNPQFEDARAKVKSIMTDFIWTMEQQRIGAEFASRVCKVDPKLLNTNSCKR